MKFLRYRKSEPIKIVFSKENGRLSSENSSINSIYSGIRVNLR